MVTTNIPEETIVKDKQRPLKVGEIVQGKVVSSGMASLFLDLGSWGTGIIYGKEFYEAKEKLKELNMGDTIFVKVVDLDNEDGYIELSLTKAGREIAWEQLKEKKEKDETIKVKILGANKGGLLAKVSDIPAFLPVSRGLPRRKRRVMGRATRNSEVVGAWGTLVRGKIIG